jgi:hypothetical protein
VRRSFFFVKYHYNHGTEKPAITADLKD